MKLGAVRIPSRHDVRWKGFLSGRTRHFLALPEFSFLLERSAEPVPHRPRGCSDKAGLHRDGRIQGSKTFTR